MNLSKTCGQLVQVRDGHRKMLIVTTVGLELATNDSVVGDRVYVMMAADVVNVLRAHLWTNKQAVRGKLTLLGSWHSASDYKRPMSPMDN